MTFATVSSEVSELLAGFRIDGWPIAATPSSTSSTGPGWAELPSSLLKTETQLGPHTGVAALAEKVPTVIAAAVSKTVTPRANTLPFTDIPVPFSRVDLVIPPG